MPSDLMQYIAIFIIGIVLIIFITNLFKKLSKNMKGFLESIETYKEDFKKQKETKLSNTEFKNLQSNAKEYLDENKNTDDILKILKRQNIHLSRISKNIQFFFWVVIISFSLSIVFCLKLLKHF